MMPWWLLLIFLRYSTKVSKDSYDYTNTNRWKDQFPMCGGPMQSPIALKPNRLALSRTPKLTFAGGLDMGEVEAVNTGREIKLKLRPRNSTEPLVQLTSFSKPLLVVYTFAQMHFHWGDHRKARGSEHAFGEKFADAEAHFVFFNQRYGNFKEAVRNFDGLLVIGVMLHGSETKKPFMFPTLGLEKRMWELAQPGKKIRLKTDLTGIQGLLRRAVSKFYSYHGSLTTPPCNPVVTWIVSASGTPISDSFLTNLCTLIFEDDDESELLVNNYRPVQNHLGRIITKHISIG